MQEMLLRAVLGGAVVSSFAILSDVLKPKSFAGLFGAAPSVALATLALAIHKHGAGYGSIEGKTMLLGAIAFFVYASVASHLMMLRKWAALPVTALALFVWLGVALGMERLIAQCESSSISPHLGARIGTNTLSALPLVAPLRCLPGLSPNNMARKLEVCS